MPGALLGKHTGRFARVQLFCWIEVGLCKSPSEAELRGRRALERIKLEQKGRGKKPCLERGCGEKAAKFRKTVLETDPDWHGVTGNAFQGRPWESLGPWEAFSPRWVLIFPLGK